MKPTKEETYRLIWNQLQNSKFKEFYTGLLLERFQQRDKWTNIFLVVVTASSVSAWAIWKTTYLQWIWAALVAASQLVSLVKPYLNYSKYMKELNEKHFLLQSLNVDYEKLWFDYKFDKLSSEQALDKAFELRNKLAKGLIFSEDIIIDDNKKLAGTAKAKLESHLRTNFNYKPVSHES